MNRQEAEQFNRLREQMEEQNRLQMALRDEPFHGNGIRYQNVFGGPANLWQYSFDTSTRRGRAGQQIRRAVLAVFVILLIVTILGAL